MLTYSFENINNTSLYEHLYTCIKEDIMLGTLSPNFKLPSKRNFAKNHNISVITVENAYGQLMAEGYIYSLPKKGFFVSNLPTSDILNNKKNSLACHEVDAPPDFVFSQSKTYIADFISNHVNKDNFPFSIWTRIMRQVMSEKRQELLNVAPSGGIWELRVAISRHLLQFRGMTVAPEQIIIGAGTEYLYSLIIQLLGHDKIYSVEDPGYKKISLIYNNNQVVCNHIPMNSSGIDMEALNSSNTDILHISPSHHYPTGIVTSISRRRELLNWASKKTTRYIIEDDYDSEFRLLGKPIPSLSSIDSNNKVIYMNTFTKALASTIRISYMVLPSTLVTKFQQNLGFYSCTVSNFEQYTLAKFIFDGYLERHINRMRVFYRNQRNILLNAIKNSNLAPYITIKEEDSGLHFLMIINTNLNDLELITLAENEDIKISFLSQYYYDSQNSIDHIAIVNYSGVDQANIDKAITALSNCLL